VFYSPFFIAWKIEETNLSDSDVLDNMEDLNLMFQDLHDHTKCMEAEAAAMINFSLLDDVSPCFCKTI